MIDDTRNPGDRAAIVSGLGLTITSQFVPFSQSRNKDEKSPSLNWRVKIFKDGRPILETDYSAGCRHCPAFNSSVRKWGSHTSVMCDEAVRLECETGREALPLAGGTIAGHKPIEIDTMGVLASLAMDSDVLDAGGFEQWASDLGYNTDSRKAEAIYRACLDIALKLRAALGDDGLSALRNAFEGY